MSRRRTAAFLAAGAISIAVAVGGCGGSAHHAASASGSTTAAGSSGSVGSSSASGAGGGSGGSTTAAVTGADPTAPPAAAVHNAQQAAGRLAGGVVATVAGQPITLAAYQKAYSAQLRSLTSSGIPLDPPGFNRCATGMERLYTRLDRGKGPHPKAPPHDALVKDCQAREQGLKQSTMTQLIQQLWTAGEAKAAGVSVSSEQLAAAVASQRRALGGAAAYARYLKRTGQTAQEASATLRLGLIEQQLQQRDLGPPVNVSQHAVAAFFAAHHAEFVIPGQPKPKLATYQARIRLVLEEQVRAQRSASATQSTERHWRALTVCRPGYVVSLCANA